MHDKELQEPQSSEVFEMTSGEKIRIEYDRIFAYKSTNKTRVTAVDLGYASDNETYLLDINFEDFDEKYQANRKAWKEYWKSQHNGMY